ncbi:MAG: efflux RND transporter periplasmic adaptor subunit [Gemmatimonadota bacterium]
MRLSKRVIVASSVVLLLALLGTGAYLRINGQRDAAAPGAGGASGDLPDVSAADQFETDILIPVEGAAVLLDTLVLAVSAQGEAASRQQTVLRAQVGGQVRAVRVAENQNVAGGTVVIEIDPTEYQLEREAALAQLRQAEAQYRELTLGDDRMEDARMRAQRDSAARARSGLDAAAVAIARAELQLARTRLTAPFGGRVANLQVVPGQYVSAGDEVLTIQAMDPIKVEAQVLESEIGFLAPGRTARVTFAAFPGEVFEGRIASINPIVEQTTRTARVSIMVANASGRILPGMYAQASLAARRFPDRVLVPRDAILERDRRNMLFVYEDGRAKWRYVNPGLMNDTQVEILEEGPEDGMVAPGEIVLVGGHYTLMHDAPVRVVDNALATEGSRVR